MGPLPHTATPYRRTPEFTEATIPAALRGRHRTKAGVWARIRVLEGRLRYRELAPSPERELTLTPARPALVAPEVPHSVEPLGKVRFFVEFLRG